MRENCTSFRTFVEERSKPGWIRWSSQFLYSTFSHISNEPDLHMTVN